MSEITSLVHTAHNSDDRYSKEIQKRMKDNWLWGFTGILYVPNKGVYIQEDPQIKGRMLFMDECELIRKLEENDPNVRFVPFGFQTGEMTPTQLAENKYIQALVGEEGAEKLAEIAGKYKNEPRLWAFKNVDEPSTRVSALGSGWVFDGGLVVVGEDDGITGGHGSDNCSFGVSRTGEASRIEK